MRNEARYAQKFFFVYLYFKQKFKTQPSYKHSGWRLFLRLLFQLLMQMMQATMTDEADVGMWD